MYSLITRKSLLSSGMSAVSRQRMVVGTSVVNNESLRPLAIRFFSESSSSSSSEDSSSRLHSTEWVLHAWCCVYSVTLLHFAYTDWSNVCIYLLNNTEYTGLNKQSLNNTYNVHAIKYKYTKTKHILQYCIQTSRIRMGKWEQIYKELW